MASSAGFESVAKAFAVGQVRLGAAVVPPEWLAWLLLGIALFVGSVVIVLQRRWFRMLLDVESETHSRDLADERARTARLLREKNDAMTSSRTQGELVSILNREVRAHLDGVIGSANLLLESKLQPAQRMQLITLRATGESLLYVLGDVQAICDVESGSITPERAPLELRTEIAQVMEVLAPRAALKGVEMTLILGHDVPRRIIGDASLLRQFFFNLTASALRLTQRGNVVLRIERTAGPSSIAASKMPWLRFGVNDAGHDVALFAEEMPVGAEAGANAEKAAQELATTMELTVTKRLVEIMGGRFGDMAVPGRAPEFWFDLPVEVETETDSLVIDQGLSRCSLVVFDDLAAARVAAAGLLKDMGIDHDLAQSTSEALGGLKEALEDRPAEVMLLVDESIANSEMDALINAFKADTALKNVKIILMSLRPERVDLDTGLPVSAVLQKPLLASREIAQAIESARTTTVLTPSKEPTLSRSPFGEKSELAGLRVLLVEDNEVSRDVSSSMLRRIGCSVEVAENGVEALKVVKKLEFDLVLMDCMMPEMDGFDATMKIREMLGSKAPPVVALTAEASGVNRTKAENSGMVDYVLKPASKGDFERVLNQWALKKGPPEK